MNGTLPDFKIHVGTSGVAAAAHLANLLAFGHIVSHPNVKGLQMGIQSLETIAVINYDRIPVAGVIPISRDHITGVGGQHRRPQPVSNVNPRVTAPKILKNYAARPPTKCPRPGCGSFRDRAGVSDHGARYERLNPARYHQPLPWFDLWIIHIQFVEETLAR